MDIKTDSNKNGIRSRSLIFLDLEMTGLETQKHEILEIGAMKVNPQTPFEIVDELEIKVKPKNIRTADKDSLKIVGYTEEGWKNALDLDSALKKLDKFASEGVIIGFNVAVDWAFLDKAYFEHGRLDPFHFRRLDVMSMAYLVLFEEQSIKRFGLGELCKFFNIEREGKHQALDDAKSTYLVFKELFEYTKKRNKK